DGDLARDIAQSAYLRVWRFAQDGDVENPRTLIFKTASNVAANEFRSRRLRRRHHAPPSDRENGDIDDAPSDAPSPERVATAKDDARLSVEVINALPDKVRRAFVMSRFQDMSYTEIAEAMGVSVSSVEKYVIAALKELRRAIENQNDAEVVAFPKRDGKTAPKAQTR
ncbi:MAG: sigma-70 family RNA polymerase sigma factor, partial [Pseudomonadota bacterium]